MDNKILHNFRNALEAVRQTIKKSKGFLNLIKILNKLLDETNTKENLVQFVQSLEKLAESNSEESLMGITLLGLCHLNGVGVPRDTKKAFDYYHRAAQQGNAYAQTWLGSCFEKGIGVSQDMAKAFELCSLAEKQGLALAQNNLGHYYINGIGVAKDAKRGVELISLAAEQGLGLAQNNLGYFYEFGIGVAKNGKRAFELYTLAVSQNIMETHHGLGSLYYKGLGVAKDQKRAVFHYRLAAEHGHSTAQAQLGYIYHSGEGALIDYKQAIKYYTLAAQQGQGLALRCLGFYYLRGLNVVKDTKKAVEYFTLGAAVGDSVALGNLGNCYHKGIGVSKDAKRAILLYQESIARGNETAKDLFYELTSEFHSFSPSTIQFLSYCSVKPGDPPFFVKGFEYLDKLKDKDLSALTTIAFCYQIGLLGVQQNIEKAIILYKQALEKGVSCYWGLYLCYRMLEQNQRLDLEAISEFYEDLKTASKNTDKKSAAKATNVLAYLHENNASVYPELSIFSAHQCYQLIHSNESFEIDESDAREHAKQKVEYFKPLFKLKEKIQEATQALPGIASIIVEYIWDDEMKERLKNERF